MTRTLALASVAALLLVGAVRLDPWLAWLVCAPLVAAGGQRGRRWAHHVLLGGVFAVEVALVGHVAWLAEAARTYFGLDGGAAALAAAALCVACALPAGVPLGLALGCAARLPGAWAVPASAAAWVAFESLTRIAFPYYPWVGLAATQADAPAVLQAASLGGAPGLALLLATAGAALGYAARIVSDGGRARAAWTAVAAAAALVVATSLFGAARLRGRSATDPLCSIAAVDAGIEAASVPREEVLERYAAASARAAAAAPDAIVWPESALPQDPLLDGELLAHLRGAATALDVAILAGGPRTGWGADWRQRRFNSLFRIAVGDPVQAYDKRRLVAFAEWWPRRLGPRPGWLPGDDLVSGDAPVLMRAGACRVGVLVCFEVEHAALARELVAAGADAIVVASNDAQLPARAVAAEVAQSRLRAVETGLPVLRAANHGASVAIDRYGLALPPAAGGVVLLPVPPPAPAPGVRWSQLVLALSWAAVLVAAASVGWRSRSR